MKWTETETRLFLIAAAKSISPGKPVKKKKKKKRKKHPQNVEADLFPLRSVYF